MLELNVHFTRKMSENVFCISFFVKVQKFWIHYDTSVATNLQNIANSFNSQKTRYFKHALRVLLVTPCELALRVVAQFCEIRKQ